MRSLPRMVMLTGLALALSAFACVAADARWVATWVSAQQLTEPGNMPPEPGLAGATLRQVIQPTLAGGRVRVMLSNEYGEKPLVVAGAHLAKSAGRSAIDPVTDRALTFNGATTVTIPPGAAMLSDDVPLAVAAFENLAVSVQLADVPARLTGHPGSRTTSFIHAGNGLSLATLPDAKETDHWYLLAAVEVLAAPAASAVVVIGDSITDGRGSTTNQNDRWPNQLARRLYANPATAQIAVLNQGTGGGRVLHDGLGDSALRRFDRDVLAVPGVRWLIVFEGVNDLGGAVGARAKGEPATTAQDLIAAYRQMILRARSHGIRVIGATIMPFAGFTSYDTPQSEADRQAVNDWIRHSGEFDGVIDFDAITRDPANPSRLSAAVDGGDHLHPSAAGYQIMADAIDLTLFSPKRSSVD
ncbi:MAG TPA: SGNH/GDSL hydrolase family protein [Opitutaceae bacterium]